MYWAPIYQCKHRQYEYSNSPLIYWFLVYCLYILFCKTDLTIYGCFQTVFVFDVVGLMVAYKIVQAALAELRAEILRALIDELIWLWILRRCRQNKLRREASWTWWTYQIFTQFYIKLFYVSPVVSNLYHFAAQHAHLGW